VITLVGIPLLMVTLLAARLFGRLEQARARALLDVDLPEPAAPHGWRGWLADAASWRALGYALLLFPVSLVTGEVTLIGWSTAVAAIAFPPMPGPSPTRRCTWVGSRSAAPRRWSPRSSLGSCCWPPCRRSPGPLAACDGALIRGLLR